MTRSDLTHVTKKLFIFNMKKTFYTYCFVFLPMLGVFIINNIFLSGSLNIFGIHPRNFKLISVFEILFSWLLHGSFYHLQTNVIILFQLLIIICLIERKPISILIGLIFLSGTFTWILGSPNSIHIGASGLVFAIFGYILGASLFAKKWLYFIPLVFITFQYYYSIKTGLIPQSGISFAAHFGGFLSGIFMGFLIGKIGKL